MKRLLPGFVVLLCFLFLGISAHAGDKAQIVWMGCGIVKKAFMGKMSEVYTKKTGITFRMAGDGATKGIRLTSRGLSDVGGTCRHLLVDKNNDVVSEEANVDLIHVAWGGLVVIVHKNNKTSNLTLQQIKDVFSGKIKNWSEVGGDENEIKLVVRESEISGVGYMTRLLLLNDENVEYMNSALRIIRLQSSGPLEKNIEKNINAIGMTDISSAKKRDVKILSIDGIYPDKSNIAEGKYPFFRPLYLVINKKSDKKARDFINFVLSDDGQSVIYSAGTVNLKEGEALRKKWKLTDLQ